eukprot:8094164-Pyramimonas_sp.AAC.1
MIRVTLVPVNYPRCFATCVAEVADHSLVCFVAPAQNGSTEFSDSLMLRAVDVFRDEGVWAIPDEGCNSCCR